MYHEPAKGGDIKGERTERVRKREREQRETKKERENIESRASRERERERERRERERDWLMIQCVCYLGGISRALKCHI